MKVLFVVLILFLFTGCSSTNKQGEKEDVFSIDVILDHVEVNLSELVEGYRFVKLETSERSIIGTIDKIQVFKDKILILDKFKARKVLVFNKACEYLYDIGKQGNGPGEYVFPMDFCIDKKAGEVIVLNSGSQLIFYNLTGRSIRNQQLNDISAIAINKNKNGFSVISGGMEDNLILTDNDVQKKFSYFPHLNSSIDRMIQNPIQAVDDSPLLYRRNLNNYIYKVDGFSIKPYRQLVFPYGNVDYDDVSSDSNYDKITDENFVVRDYLESTSKAYFVFMRGRDIYFSVFDKIKDTCKTINYKKFINDIAYDKRSFIVDVCPNEDTYIWVNSMRNVLNGLNHNAGDVNSDSYRLLSSLIAGEDDSSNPLLLFTTFKH